MDVWCDVWMSLLNNILKQVLFAEFAQSLCHSEFFFLYPLFAIFKIKVKTSRFASVVVTSDQLFMYLYAVLILLSVQFWKFSTTPQRFNHPYLILFPERTFRDISTYVGVKHCAKFIAIFVSTIFWIRMNDIFLLSGDNVSNLSGCWKLMWKTTRWGKQSFSVTFSYIFCCVLKCFSLQNNFPVLNYKMAATFLLFIKLFSVYIHLVVHWRVFERRRKLWHWQKLKAWINTKLHHFFSFSIRDSFDDDCD